MRKTIAILTLLMALCTHSRVAKAADEGFYAGADYSYTHFGYNDDTIATGVRFSDVIAEDYSGYAPYVGYKFNKNIALEIGYSGQMEESSSITVGGTTYTGDANYWSFFGDIVGIIPVNDQFNILGAIGYERITAEYDLKAVSGTGSSSVSVSNDTNAYRLGLGAEYEINEKIGIRAMVRYAAVDFQGVDNYVQATVGLKYTF